jgi:hypothetical protein
MPFSYFIAYLLLRKNPAFLSNAYLNNYLGMQCFTSRLSLRIRQETRGSKKVPERKFVVTGLYAKLCSAIFSTITLEDCLGEWLK